MKPKKLGYGTRTKEAKEIIRSIDKIGFVRPDRGVLIRLVLLILRKKGEWR